MQQVTDSFHLTFDNVCDILGVEHNWFKKRGYNIFEMFPHWRNVNNGESYNEDELQIHL